ncbi:MAG TPA: P-loop NTPase, partial [Candidatus Binataceae bacterium]|nr:P-loop NTPase [Candidatus Binataceae bacterium]
MRVFVDSGGFTADLPEIPSDLDSTASVLALASANGGSGKSLLAANFAVAFALAGKKVGIVDADLNAPTIFTMLGVKAPMHLDMGEIQPVAGPMGLRLVDSHLIAEGQRPAFSFAGFAEGEERPAAPRPIEIGYAAALRRLLFESRFGALDVLVVDLAPGLEHVYRLSAMLPRTEYVVVSHPTVHAAHAAREIFAMHRQGTFRVVGVVENMHGFYCETCRAVRPLFPEGETNRGAREAGIPVIAKLPFDPRLGESAERGVPIVHSDPEMPLSKQMTATARQILGMLT